ncbi:hypothetical protein Dimus_023702 [Dionaea muscipula]
MEKDHHQKQELQLLPPPPPPPPTTTTSSSTWFPAACSKPSCSTPLKPSKAPPAYFDHQIQLGRSSSPLDLQLSMSLQPNIGRPLMRPEDRPGCIQALKWQAAEQIRLAALEKAYAEHVRELTRREMELAQSEFARARMIWERAKEDAAKADKLRENSTGKIHSSSYNSSSPSSSSFSCSEITCHSCRQRFPYCWPMNTRKSHINKIKIHEDS